MLHSFDLNVEVVEDDVCWPDELMLWLNRKIHIFTDRGVRAFANRRVSGLRSQQF